MMDRTAETFSWLENKIRQGRALEKSGRVMEVRGLIVESDGPEASVGEICTIECPQSEHSVDAEVVGFRGHRLLLMPYWQTLNIHPGARVIAAQEPRQIAVGEALIGRVIDAQGQPLDGKGPIRALERTPLYRDPPNPMTRRRIEQRFITGVRAIDLFTPMGEGQRMGVFAGSGVGKSTLMGMIARGASGDLNVIALVGERGRELREFIENDLGPEGLRRSVVVVATSDQAAPLRLRAAILATAIAEYFRDQGKKVMMLMDSLTRLAMAQREIGLAVGEPPTARGYTPSVFALLPRLLERSGMGSQGSITALYTVLVEGDDMNEPVADTVRGILDGHLVLSRHLATANHYPAIDVLGSVSRLVRAVCTPAQLDLAAQARDLMALYKRNEDLISVGAYSQGTNPRLDRAVAKHQAFTDLLRQKQEEISHPDRDWPKLAGILS